MVVHYGLMTLVSLTTVGSFQAVGWVLVVAFMIGPPITAYLLTDDLDDLKVANDNELLERLENEQKSHQADIIEPK